MRKAVHDVLGAVDFKFGNHVPVELGDSNLSTRPPQVRQKRDVTTVGRSTDDRFGGRERVGRAPGKRNACERRSVAAPPNVVDSLSILAPARRVHATDAVEHSLIAAVAWHHEEAKPRTRRLRSRWKGFEKCDPPSVSRDASHPRRHDANAMRLGDWH